MRNTASHRNKQEGTYTAGPGWGRRGDSSRYREPKAYVEPDYASMAADPVVEYMSRPQLEKSIERTRKLMQDAAKKLEFIQAAQYRDELLKLEDLLKEKAD